MEWIETNIRLPEGGERMYGIRVWAYIERTQPNDKRRSFHQCELVFKNGHFHHQYSRGKIVPSVLYWMYLPKPPKKLPQINRNILPVNLQ